MKIKMLSVVFVLLTATSISQTPLPTKKVFHSIGFHSGTTSGVGLSYKARIKDLYQIQLTSLPYASADVKTVISGINLGYKFINKPKFGVLAVLSGGHYFNSRIEEGYILDANNNYYFGEKKQLTNKLSGSLGLGFELSASDIVKFNVQVGYAVYDIFDDWKTLPSIGAGVDFLIFTKMK